MGCDSLNIPKGADHLRTIIMLDENNDPINGTLLDKIVIVVKHVNGTVIAKFSKNAATGYYPMDLTDIATGKIKIKILSIHTATAATGKLVYGIHAQFPDGTITDDGVLDLINEDTYLCNLIDSVTSGITLP